MLRNEFPQALGAESSENPAGFIALISRHASTGIPCDIIDESYDPLR